MPEGINALDWSYDDDDSKDRCNNCGAHFLVDPWGQVQDSACPECGGTRMFRTQPSPVRDDLRGLNGMKDMPGAAGSDSPQDTGGNILQEGLAKSYSHFLVSFTTCPSCGGDVVDGMGCPNCGAKESVPSGTMTPNGNSSNMDLAKGTAGYPLDEGTIVGKDGEPNPYASTHGYDGYTHSHVRSLPYSNNRKINSEAMIEFPDRSQISLEPYAPLWSDEHVSGILGDIGTAVGIGAANLVPGLGEAVDMGALADGASSLMKGVGFVNNMFGGGPGGSTGTGMYPTAPPAPNTMQQLGSVDIPMLLLADFETYDAVKSVDEHHNDPAKQDQKEFDYGDKSPSNFHNPNNQDSGAAGEDGIRDATPGYGFGTDSPALQHMHGLLPLIMHYLTNGLDGTDDPILQDLHEKLESENPGYLDKESENGPQLVEIMIQRHKSPKEEADKAKSEDKAKKAARVATVPLSPFPTPASAVDQGFTPGTDINPPLGELQYCPKCGSVLNGDHTCPHCGYPSVGGGAPNNAPQQLNASVLANHQGPITPQQFEAAESYLKENGQQGLVQQLYEHPENFGWLMDEIQQNPQPTPPLVAPEPQTAMPAPMDAAPGGMPVPDPSQPGAGGAPMQPMAAVLSSPGDIKLYYEIAELRKRLPLYVQHQIDDIVLHYGPRAGLNAIYEVLGPAPTPKDDGLGQAVPSLYSKASDANNMVPRCPSCGSASTSIMDGNDETVPKAGHCHSCQYNWYLPLNIHGTPPHTGGLVALANPSMDPQAIWSDVNGNPIQAGEHYSLYTQGMPVPDEVVVIDKKPGELWMQIDGTSADFKVSAEDVMKGKYSFEPATNVAADKTAVPHGGHPLDNANIIEEPTTDEMRDQYPNTTVSHVQDVDDDTCRKCGSVDTTSFMSSPDVLMHECYKCASVWETHLEDEISEEHHSSRDWLKSDDDDDFFAEYERHRAGYVDAPGQSFSTQSRNIRDIAQGDPRLAEIRQRLDNNPSIKDMIREAGKNFTHAEKRELIEESGVARNMDRLDLSNTHYNIDNDYIARRSGNEYDAPDEHLIFGI